MPIFRGNDTLVMIRCFFTVQFVEAVYLSISTQKHIVPLANMFSTKLSRTSSKLRTNGSNFYKL